MRVQNKAILSLGSNTGNRLQNLQSATNYIHNHIATVVKVSPVYETPAWGFEGDDFYNCAILVHTKKDAAELLDALLNAEAIAGRLRNDEPGYSSRSIDIDIISFNDSIISEHHLHVPHPRMHERNFVLHPLRDVAPAWMHPVSGKTINELVNTSPDASNCIIAGRLIDPLNSVKLTAIKYLAVEGNIGAGKTSLSAKLSEDFNGRLVRERFADNPFLPLFYQDQSRYAFSLEMSFLAERYQQLTDDLASHEQAGDFVVADYYIIKSLIFSKVTLNEEEYMLYRRVFDIMYKEIPKLGLYIYLCQNTGRLLENIHLRGREYELDIKAEYLDAINSGYLEFINSQHGLKVLTLDMTNRDFVNIQEDYIWILDKISNAILND